MCGRFSLIASPQEVQAFLDLDDIEPFPPRYNIAPTQPVLVIMMDGNGIRRGILVRWGLVPSWVKDPKAFCLLINARSETADTKASFRTAMRYRRVLIPASGYYEWHRSENRKQPYWIMPGAGGLVGFAGLMETWIGPDGEEIDTGCILTAEAIGPIAKIHHRVPVVIDPADQDKWLDCRSQDAGEIKHLLRPPPVELFEAVAVSDKVNKVANAGPDIQEPVEIKPHNNAQVVEVKPAQSELF